MLPGAAVGLMGLLLGAVSAIFGVAPLGLVAGACALAGGMIAIIQSRRVQEAESAAASAVDAVTLRHLELFTSARDRSLVDDETGLPDQRFFELALEGRVAAARRHLWPVTLVLVHLEIDVPPGDEHAEAEALASFSVLLRRTLREADIACRLSGTRFAMILEDTAEEGAVWTAERLQIGLARNTGHITRLSAGVASYPTHAMQANEMLSQADDALARACAAEPDHGLGPVEVAHVDLT